MINIKIISIIAGVFILGGIILLVTGQKKEGQSRFTALLLSNLLSTNRENDDDTTTSPEETAGGAPAAGSGLLSVQYRDPKLRFTISIPSDFQATDMNQGEDGDTVVFGKKEGFDSFQKTGFQIFILPFDEEGPMTAQRIHEDLPDLPIANKKNVLIDGVNAFVFQSEENDIGPTIEVWFVRKGFLYQIMAWREYEAPLSQILSAWKFID